VETTLSERFRILLKEQCLKQAELADALGVSANYISLLVHGRKTQVSLTLAKLVEALYGYTAEWLITGNGVKNRADVLRQQAMERIMKMGSMDLIKLQDFIRHED
jgi:transcriptional regulator with XRE-family HTH domain